MAERYRERKAEEERLDSMNRRFFLQFLTFLATHALMPRGLMARVAQAPSPIPDLPTTDVTAPPLKPAILKRPHVYGFNFNVGLGRSQSDAITFPHDFLCRSIQTNSTGKFDLIYQKNFSNRPQMPCLFPQLDQSFRLPIPIPIPFQAGSELTVTVVNRQPGREWNRIRLDFMGIQLEAKN